MQTKDSNKGQTRIIQRDNNIETTITTLKDVTNRQDRASHRGKDTEGFCQPKSIREIHWCQHTRPDLCAQIKLISPGNKPTTAIEYKSLSKLIRYLKETKDHGLNYVTLGIETARILLLTGASFENSEGSRSQLGYSILMVDEKNKCSILH